MKIKTSELIGLALDWAVAKCEGLTPAIIRGRWFPHEITLRDAVGSRRVVCGGWHPSTNWAQGGPIIEREGITIVRCDDDYGVDEKGFCNSVSIPVWAATTGHHSLHRGYDEPEPSLSQYESELIFGSTPLIAAMRCYVASKLGDEIDVPEELLK